MATLCCSFLLCTYLLGPGSPSSLKIAITPSKTVVVHCIHLCGRELQLSAECRASRLGFQSWLLYTLFLAVRCMLLRPLLYTISSSVMRSLPYPVIFCVAFDKQICFKKAFLRIIIFLPLFLSVPIAKLFIFIICIQCCLLYYWNPAYTLNIMI